jgi:hypothetical protein
MAHEMKGGILFFSIPTRLQEIIKCAQTIIYLYYKKKGLRRCGISRAKISLVDNFPF